MPALHALRNRKALPAAATGALFGAASTLGSQYWLSSFHPAALVLAATLAALEYAALFLLVGAARRRFPRAGSLVAAGLWVGLEYLRTKGFFGYSFGLLGYSQYLVAPLLRLASATGVFGASFVLVLANAALADLAGLAPGLVRRSAGSKAGPGPAIAPATTPATTPAAVARQRSLAAFAALGAALAALLCLSLPAPARMVEQSLRVALVQPDARTRQLGAADYREALAELFRLSDRALAADPARKVDLLVWHETAIVPSLNWHRTVRNDPEVWAVVAEAERRIEALPVPLLFGNSLTEIRTGAGGEPERLERNAAILAGSGARQAYTKTLLVPFAETFPADRLPRLGALARRLFGEGWAPGTGPTLLRLEPRGAPEAGSEAIPFGTPICFEDGFGEYCAEFARGGARFLAVLTSDAWARSASCQRQHLAASVFRAAETGLPLLRAASTGATALVGPDGAILASLPPFTAGYLLVDLDLPAPGATPYLLLGDLPAGLAGLGALLALALSFAPSLAKADRGGRCLLAAAAARRRRSH